MDLTLPIWYVFMGYFYSSIAQAMLQIDSFMAITMPSIRVNAI
jgi:hypothetical protein